MARINSQAARSVITAIAASVCVFAAPTSALAQTADACAAGGASSTASYNYVLGTQAIGGPYQFTQYSSLLEQAVQIQGLGSNLLKLSLGKGAAERYGTAAQAKNSSSVLEYVKSSKDIQLALDLDFTYYQAWVHSFTGAEWQDGVSAREEKAYYDEMYELSAWLLTKYSGTGKTFMLGNWEGDWLLAGGRGKKSTPTIDAVQGMIDWLNIRQKAIDDAKAAVPHSDVELYHYVEVNLVRKAMEGNRSIAHSVLPKTNVDLVSYSSYEAIKQSQKPDLESIRQPLTAITQYLQGQLQPKEGLPFKNRVFIGEYGYHANKDKPISIKNQFVKSKYVMQVALELDMPFALIWQLYNNEYAPNGTSKEMSLIDESGRKRELYYLHQRYLKKMGEFVSESCAKNGTVPTQEAFKARALEVLSNISFGEMEKLASAT